MHLLWMRPCISITQLITRPTEGAGEDRQGISVHPEDSERGSIPKLAGPALIREVGKEEGQTRSFPHMT